MDFVTVCFKNDLPQMSLQAASMDKFLRDFPVDRIIVILNEDTDAARSYFHDKVWPLYGHLIERVVLVNHTGMADHKILPCPHCKKRNPGCTYCYQQHLKLLGSRLVSSDFYCILDAKNWLTRTWTMKDIQDDRGRLRITYDPGIDPNWRGHRRDSLSYFGFDDEQHPPICNLTPFFVYTDIARGIVDDSALIQRWSETPMTEFYLLEGAILKKHGSVDAAYWKSPTFMTSIWPFTIEQLDMDTMMSEFIEPKRETLCSGMHRNCYRMLTERNIRELVDNYVRLNLLDEQQTLALIDEMKILND